MGTKEAIEKRRSIRKFKKNDIDKEKINAILEAGRLSPSAKNRQPWYFVVVNESIKNQIADIMINHKQKKGQEGDYGYSSSITFTGEIIKEGTVLILIFTEEDENYLISDTLSIGACIENMILMATDLDLGTLWIRDTSHVEKEISSLVGETKKLSSALLIGVPDQNPNQRTKKNLKDISKWL